MIRMCKLSAAILLLAIVASILPIPASAKATTSGKCGDSLIWTLDEAGTLMISGTGDMYEYDYKTNNLPEWYPNIGLRDEYPVYNIIIEDGVTSVGRYAFGDNPNLVSVSIPKTVTSIGDLAFCGCPKLAEIALPDSLVYIGDCAFYDTGLASITIPAGVNSIGGRAFAGTNIAEITVSPKNSSYTVLNNVLYSKDMTNLVFYPSARAGSVFVVPDSVTDLSIGVFYGCKSLVSIKLPDGLTEISDYSFFNCSSLADINIPDGVISIGNSAFWYCSGLREISIPNSVASIGEEAFVSCSSLKYVIIPYGVTEIRYATFQGCRALVSVSIPDGVTGIGQVAFGICTSLVSVTIPDSVISIGDGAFCICTSLQKITIPNNVTSIGASAFNQCSSLNEIIFCGEAPSEFGEYTYISFSGVLDDVSSLTAYYPVNSGWENWIEHYQNINWVIDEPSPWAQTEVDVAEALGLVTECTGVGYQSRITRLQFADIVVNMVEEVLGEEIIPADFSTFWDSDDTAVLKAYAAGITDGIGDGSFSPGSFATREQIATMLCRAIMYIEAQMGKTYIDMDGSIPDNYIDRNSISSWASPSVSALVDNDIMTGISETELSPKRSTTTQECILLVLRISNLIA